MTNIPGAYSTISQILATPAPARSVPEVSIKTIGPIGAYFSLQLSRQPPLPGDFFPNLPTYGLDVTNGIFVIDDRSVDYPALEAETAAEGLANPVVGRADDLTIDTNRLWLEAPTNALPGSNLFNVVIHETTQGDYYDVLTKSDLLLPSWTVENTVTGAVGNLTLVTLSQNGRTNLFVWARESVIPVYTQPMSQEVVAGDAVTFTVAAGGSGLFYQWTFDGTNIFGATGSSYTVNLVQSTNAGDYACIITSAAGTVISHTATLTVDAGSSDPNSMMILGQRQDYTFRDGMEYYIGSTVELYGNTTLEAGTVLKFDYTQPYPSLEILGTLTSKGTVYNPSILTTVDDDAYGEWWSYGPPGPVVTGVPYLDLTMAGSLSITNVHFRFADEAVATPAGGRVDFWDCQFFECDAAIINEFGGADGLHNVLFAGCYDAVAALTNRFAITAEHITADVSNLCDAPISAAFVGLTNSIILGNIGSVSTLSAPNTSIGPDPSNFQTNGAGNYYLAAGSSLHHYGTTNISPYLLNEFRAKTTYAPLSLPAQMAISGNLTLFPQAPRYTNGAPDIGYFYDALDYTVAGLTNFGSITIEPGAAIGFRENFNSYDENLNSISSWGFDARENSALVAHGTPNQPIVFADVQMVDEQFAMPCFADFVPDFEGGTDQAGPTLDFRFCNFYAAPRAYHVWSGMDAAGDAMASYNSVVNWTMRDCNLHDGQISLGEPDSGGFEGWSGFFGIPYTTFYGSCAVSWNNNLFDAVQINLQPTFDWYDGTVNIDFALQARNNLFRTHGEFVIIPVQASAGNWTFTDDLFDQAQLFEETSLPLDYDYNAYWPLTTTFYNGDITRLQPTTPGDGTTNGLNEVVLNVAPPYASGPFGDYYLSRMTPLWQAGSQTASAAGLTQYTTFTNQAKDTASQPVNIGLHYVAGTNGLPLDSDGDGIPDYVEVENGTDPNNAMTDGETPDAFNAAYDNVDLSGDGLVGRVKAALGMNPLDSSNPLTLNKVTLGGEPDVTTFEIPVSYSTMTNIGAVHLMLNGVPAVFDNIAPAADGNTLLVWSAVYDPPQKTFNLQAQIALNSFGDDHAVLSGLGTLSPFYYDNDLQYFQSDGYFDDNGAYLDAQLPSSFAGQNVNYTVQIFDPSTSPETLIWTVKSLCNFVKIEDL